MVNIILIVGNWLINQSMVKIVLNLGNWMIKIYV